MRILLNLLKKENYMFIDEESRSFCNIANPLCNASCLSKRIIMGIKSNTIIDVDDMSGIKMPNNIELLHNKLLQHFNIKKISKNKVNKEKKEDAAINKSAIEKLIVEDTQKEETQQENKKKPKSKKTKKA